MTLPLALIAPALTLFTPPFGHQQDHLAARRAQTMGRRRVSLAFLAIVSGLMTFFVPLVTTDPPVLGRGHWSPWDIFSAITIGELPIKRDDLLSSLPIMATAIYVLLIIALVALGFSRSPRILARVAAVGCFTSWFWRGDRISLEEMFYGDFSYHRFSLVRHVGFGGLTLCLLGVMGSLLFIAMNEDIDEHPSPKSRQTGAIGWETREPETLDAEILPPNAGEDRRGSQRLRR